MNKQQLKQTIDDNITTNGQNEITGAKLNDVLNEMVDSLGVVDQISVGTTTTGAAGTDASVTNSGTSTDPVLNFTIPRGAAGQDGANAVNPFKGWWADLATLKAAITAQPGDSAYVKDASPATTWSIYVYSASATSDNNWVDSGSKADTSNVQTFASGEEVNEVHIVNDVTTGGEHDVLSAEQGVQLNCTVGRLDQLVSNFLVQTIEDGFFVVDNDLNIGVKVDSDGLQAINLDLEYNIIN